MQALLAVEMLHKGGQLCIKIGNYRKKKSLVTDANNVPTGNLCLQIHVTNHFIVAINRPHATAMYGKDRGYTGIFIGDFFCLWTQYYTG